MRSDRVIQLTFVNKQLLEPNTRSDRQTDLAQPVDQNTVLPVTRSTLPKFDGLLQARVVSTDDSLDRRFHETRATQPEQPLAYGYGTPVGRIGNPSEQLTGALTSSHCFFYRCRD